MSAPLNAALPPYPNDLSERDMTLIGQFVEQLKNASELLCQMEPRTVALAMADQTTRRNIQRIDSTKQMWASIMTDVANGLDQNITRLDAIKHKYNENIRCMNQIFNMFESREFQSACANFEKFISLCERFEKIKSSGVLDAILSASTAL